MFHVEHLSNALTGTSNPLAVPNARVICSLSAVEGFCSKSPRLRSVTGHFIVCTLSVVEGRSVTGHLIIRSLSVAEGRSVTEHLIIRSMSAAEGFCSKSPRLRSVTQTLDLTVFRVLSK